MAYTCKCLVKFPQHSSLVTVNHTHIHVFKYNSRSCDFEVFKLAEQDLASDYIMQDLPTIYYKVSVFGD